MGSSSSSSEQDDSVASPVRQDTYLRVFSSTIFVRNHDRSLQFYVTKLGFRVVFDTLLAGERWIAIAPPKGDSILALVVPAPGSEAAGSIGRHMQLAFITEDLPALFELWSSRGVGFSRPPEPTVWGGLLAAFEDEDGNSFELISSDQMNREIEAQRQAHAARLESERRAARELEIAKEVQARLFPQVLPPVSTLAYAGVCLQAKQVGGDYYDFLDLSRDRLGIVIGDISGKGIAAALLMANLQANLRSQCAIAVDQPERLLQSVNELFYRNTANSAYATLFFAEFDGRTGRLHYANCGHLSAILLRHDSRLELLESTSTVLGLFKDWTCEFEERWLTPGDIFVLYTDGVTESFNENDEEFGEQRLLDALIRYRELAPEALVASIVEELRRFSRREQHDDITLIVAKCKSA